MTSRPFLMRPAMWPHRLLDRFEEHVEAGALEIRLPGGSARRLQGRTDGPEAVIDLHRARALLRLAAGGGSGFARAYIAGDWTSPDLAAVIQFGAANRRRMGGRLAGSPPVRLLGRLGHALRGNRRGQARRNIASHYDLGDDFYGAWLDETMTYSAAVFEADANSLEAAQRTKYRRILDLLGAQPGQHLLEIGCGWGAFAELAAAERGLDVTAITISRAQYAYARERISRAGLADKVEIRLQDYRDVSGQFDHIASIEMVEAVGERYWPVFFKSMADALRPGGRIALQAIVIAGDLFADYRRNADFIQREIFPGGMLPSLGVIDSCAGAAGLGRLACDSFGRHYAETLRLWRTRFLEAFEAGRLPMGVDARFRRLWEYYLAYCEGGFRAGNIDLLQLTLTPRPSIPDRG